METNDYLTKQIITYMGNKRKLLSNINTVVDEIQDILKKDNLIIGDGFSGSGITSRLFKTKANKLYVNDIAGYSKTLNNCYLSTPNNETIKKIHKYIDKANEIANNNNDTKEPWISKHWSPNDDNNIKENERAYFTNNNGKRIDKIRDYIEKIPENIRDYIKAPLLVESSIHNNTNGQFSAFYKDGSIGKYGGKKSTDIKRITKSIELPYPIFNKNNCDVEVSQSDTNNWVQNIPEVDIMYYDPPYNKHPYNIYYFLLDIINNWDKTIDIPNTNRGQPNERVKSSYNSSIHAESALINLLKNTKATYIILSYNDGGIISIPRLDEILKKYKDVNKIPINHKVYNRLKGISNYKREKDYTDVKEFLYVIKK